jgi:hypothetical protein
LINGAAGSGKSTIASALAQDSLMALAGASQKDAVVDLALRSQWDEERNVRCRGHLCSLPGRALCYSFAIRVLDCPDEFLLRRALGGLSAHRRDSKVGSRPEALVHAGVGSSVSSAKVRK